MMTFLPHLLHTLEMMSGLSTCPLEHPHDAPDNEAEARVPTLQDAHMMMPQTMPRLLPLQHGKGALIMTVKRGDFL